MRELVKSIARQLTQIDTEDLSKCEKNIAQMLEDEGILKKSTAHGYTVYVMVD